MHELLPQNKLTIVCNLEIYYSDRLTGGKLPTAMDTKNDLDNNTPSLGDDLAAASTFAMDSNFSDITLVCGSKHFPCHKIILSSRSGKH